MYKPQKWWFPCLHTCRRSYQWNTVQQVGCCYCWTPKFVGRYRSRRRSRSPPRRRWRTLPTLSKTEVHNRRRDACAGGDPAPPRHTTKRPALSDLRALIPRGTKRVLNSALICYLSTLIGTKFASRFGVGVLVTWSRVCVWDFHLALAGVSEAGSNTVTDKVVYLRSGSRPLMRFTGMKVPEVPSIIS